MGTPPRLCIQGPPLPVRGSCPVGCRGGNKRWSRPGNSTGNTDQESHQPGDSEPPALRRPDLEGQETSSARALLRRPAPSGGPSQGTVNSPASLGAPLYQSAFMMAPPFPLRWSPPANRSLEKEGVDILNLSWRACSLGLGLPWWLRR